MIIVRVHPVAAAPAFGQPAGFGWVMWRDETCVGTAEASSKTVLGAIGSAIRFAERQGLGMVDTVTVAKPEETAHAG